MRSGGLPSELNRTISAQLGAERLERAGEQALERSTISGERDKRAGGLVEELEPLMALALER